MRPTLLSFSFLLLFALACGDDAGDGDGTGNGNGGGADAATGSGDFACSSIECDPGTEYCLITVVNGVEATVDCIALPDACADCDCASDDAPEQFPTSTNCSSLISCSQSNDEITVECQSSL